MLVQISPKQRPQASFVIEFFVERIEETILFGPRDIIQKIAASLLIADGNTGSKKDQRLSNKVGALWRTKAFEAGDTLVDDFASLVVKELYNPAVIEFSHKHRC